MENVYFAVLDYALKQRLHDIHLACIHKNHDTKKRLTKLKKRSAEFGWRVTPYSILQVLFDAHVTWLTLCIRQCHFLPVNLCTCSMSRPLHNFTSVSQTPAKARNTSGRNSNKTKQELIINGDWLVSEKKRFCRLGKGVTTWSDGDNCRWA